MKSLPFLLSAGSGRPKLRFSQKISPEDGASWKSARWKACPGDVFGPAAPHAAQHTETARPEPFKSMPGVSGKIWTKSQAWLRDSARGKRFVMSDAPATFQKDHFAAEIRPGDAEIFRRLEEFERSARGTVAENTVLALRRGTDVWILWCMTHGRTSLPASPHDLAAFIDEKSESHAPATVQQWVWAVSRLHRAGGIANPASSDTVRHAITRMLKTFGSAQEQAEPLTWGRVEIIVGELRSRFDLEPGGLKARRDAALILTAYDTMARRSELVGLTLGCLKLGLDDGGRCVIRRSKTDQTGKGSTRYLSPETCDALDTWLRAARIDRTVRDRADDPVFRSVSRHEIVGPALSPEDVRRLFKQMSERAGIDAVGISGHSTRVGAAQDLVADSHGLAEVMLAGGWKTPKMVAHYAREAEAGRGAMAKTAAKRRLAREKRKAIGINS